MRYTHGNRNERVAYSSFRVIVGMYSEGYVTSNVIKVLVDGIDNWGYLVGQGTTISIAKHQAFSPTCHSFIKSGKGILPILFEAVKKMLRIIKKMLNVGFEVLQGFNNDGEIVLK